MRLLRLEAKDFLSYPKLELDLSDVGQLAIVGDNGAGKSAILDAVLWCVYGLGRASADEMTREGAIGCYVKTTWLRGEQEVVISRSRSKESSAGESSLSLYVDGDKRSSHTIAETQKSIVTLMGMPAEALLAGPVMVQGESGSFLKAKPAERKDLLVHLFGLERWEAYHEAAKVDLAVASSRADDVAVALANADAAIAGINEVELVTRAKGYEQLIRDCLSQQEALQARNDELVSEGSALKERAIRARQLQTEAAEVLQRVERSQDRQAAALLKRDSAAERLKEKEPQVTAVIPQEGNVAGIRATIPTMRDRHLEAVSAVATVSGLNQRRSIVEARANTNTPCEGDPPSCRYLVLRNEAQAELEEIDASLEHLSVTAAGEPALKANLKEFEDHLAAFDLQVSQATRDLHAQEMAHTMWESLIVRAEAEIEQATQTLERETEEIEVGLGRHKTLIEEAMRIQQDEQRMGEVAEQLRGVIADAKKVDDDLVSARARLGYVEAEKARLASLVADRERAAASVDEANSDVDTLTVVTAMFHRNGIPTLLLETAIPEIEARANEILARQPGDFSLRIETQTATKSASFKDTLAVVVTAGDNDRAYDLLSGGQKFRVDFALRIALSSVIASRYGADVDTLWLDEPLGPLDPAGQEAVAQTLASVAGDFGLIVVVSHAPTFSDLFDTRLTITMQDHESEIAWAS